MPTAAKKGRRAAARKSVAAGQRRPEVRVTWRELDASPAQREAQARRIAETVLGHMQRDTSAPEILSARQTSSSDAGETAQAREPLSYVEAADRLAGVQWDPADRGTLLLVTESGEIVTGKPSVRGHDSPSITSVTERARRQSPRINFRPGRGGTHRRPVDVDVEEELDNYGEIVWRSVNGGAMVGTMELDPKGNTVLFHRLSSDDKGERFIEQLRANIGLANAQSETLRPRVAVFAKNMTGTEIREVRHHRAGAPPSGVLERDDILLLDDYIVAGWVEHVVWRDPTRIARAALPAEMIFATLQREKIGLWIAWYGRQINWTEDGSRLRHDVAFSAQDRDFTVRKLQTALANKGILAGNGHLGPVPIGVVRDKHTRKRRDDPEQMKWINRAYELAESGLCDDKRGLSVRHVKRALEEEGFVASVETVRRILTRPLYATGENSARLRGVEIGQDAVQMSNPVPLDRYLRVQEMFGLRKGSDKNTPVGEFLFNHVETVHMQCDGCVNKNGVPSRIKGYVTVRRGKERKTRRMWHNTFTPPQCKGTGRGPGGGHSWLRGDLEPHVVEKVREIASHPEILRQLALASRHTLSDADVRLTDLERAQIENEIERLERDKEAATDAWVLGFAGGRQLRDDEKSYKNFEKFISSFDRQIAQKSRRLERDAAAAAASEGKHDPRHEDRLNAFLEIMTVETPDDPAMKILRARLFQRVVSRVVIDDPGDGPIEITVEGHLIPDQSTVDEGNPILAASDLLDDYALKKAGKTPEAELLVERARRVETDLSALAEESVSALYSTFEGMPSTSQVDEARRRMLDSVEWTTRHRHSARKGVPAWRCPVVVELT